MFFRPEMQALGSISSLATWFVKHRADRVLKKMLFRYQKTYFVSSKGYMNINSILVPM